MIIPNAKVLRLGVANHNGRIYTEENIREVVREFNHRLRTYGVVYGQLGHPQDTQDTSFPDVSHIIKSLRVQGDFLLARIETLATPCGKILRADINDYVFRTRSIGNVDDKGEVTVQRLLSIDAILVEDDSYAGLMEENYEDE